jgi:hypothetical protein
VTLSINIVRQGRDTHGAIAWTSAVSAALQVKDKEPDPPAPDTYPIPCSSRAAA